MNAPAAPASSADAPRRTLGRRLYRGVIFAIFVGVVGTALAAVPGLFIQSIFVGEAQRCIEAQTKDIAATGEIQTNCGAGFADAPVWLPPAIIFSGTVIGLAGGFGYGFIAPRPVPGDRREREQPWLPF